MIKFSVDFEKLFLILYNIIMIIYTFVIKQDLDDIAIMFILIII